MFLKEKDAKQNQFLLALTFSAFGFFEFGWHVHEKAILMIFFPMLLLTFQVNNFFKKKNFF